jgi:membrane-anchored glycerophosphoryl diester phosphodiesterase (GDPDase)
VEVPVSRWKTSKALSEKSWTIVKENKALVAFPIRGAVVGAMFALVGIVPGFVLLAVSDGNIALLVAGGLLILLGAYLANLGSLVFGAGLVSAADELLHDRPTSYAEAMSASKPARGSLARWAAINLVVNALIGLVQGDGEGGVVATVLRTIVAGIALAAWTAINWFVLPYIVLEQLGATDAIKHSASLVRKRWGETIMGGIRITVRATWFLVVPGIILLAAGAVLALTIENTAAIVAGAVLGGLGFALIIAGSVIGSAARTVFAVALYRWATEGQAVGPFTAEELQQSVLTKSAPGARAA